MKIDNYTSKTGATNEFRFQAHEILLSASIETVFKILIHPTAICDWWQASSAIIIPEQNGIWAATWGDLDNPDYVSVYEITEYQYPHTIVLSNVRYLTKDGNPDFDMENLAVKFELTQKGELSSILKVINSGFPISSQADKFFEVCLDGWKQTFAGIKRYVDK